MQKIKLVTASGDFVTEVTIPPFLTPPDVLLWGERTFKADMLDRELYREAFMFVVPVDRETPVGERSTDPEIYVPPPVKRYQFDELADGRVTLLVQKTGDRNATATSFPPDVSARLREKLESLIR